MSTKRALAFAILFSVVFTLGVIALVSRYQIPLLTPSLKPEDKPKP